MKENRHGIFRVKALSFCVFTCLVFLLPEKCGAQTPIRFERVPFLRFETVQTIFQDRTGYLWFGTLDGLYR